MENPGNITTTKNNRRSVRLPAYDYSLSGRYFVTICAQSRECLFGEIKNEEMILNEFGQVVQEEWLKTAELRPDVELGTAVVMPNHFHGIIVINDDCRGTARRAPTVSRFGKPVAGALSTIIRSYKSAVTKRINEIRRTPGMAVWQPNYYEHIIRNEDDLKKIHDYILYNPAKWTEDNENPKNVGAGPRARPAPKTARSPQKTGQSRGVAPTDNR